MRFGEIEALGNIKIDSDTKKLYLGADQDCEFYHTGSNLMLYNLTGDIYISAEGRQIAFTDDDLAQIRSIDMGSSIANAGTFTMTMGEQTSDPNFTIDLANDDTGDTTIATNTGDIIFVPTGIANIQKADPELHLTDTGNSEYTRLTRADTNNKAVLYNRILENLGGSGSSYELTFNGSSDYVSIGTGATTVMDTEFTLEAWVKPTLGATLSVIAKGSQVAGWESYLMGIYGDGKVQAGITNGSTYSYVKSTNALGDGAWSHIAVTWKYTGAGGMTDFKIYINGVLESNVAVAETTEPATLSAATGDTRIGHTVDQAYYMNGVIDEPRIYNIELSGAIIAAHYANGNGQYGWVETGLKAGYHFDENTGVSTADYSGNTNTGTISGATWVAGEKANPVSASNEVVFDGNNSCVDCGTNSSLDLGNTFSIEAWINPTALVNYAGIVSKVINDRNPLSAADYTFMMVCHNDGTIGSYNGSPGGWTFSTNAGITTGNWYHCVWILDGGTIYYYVNGTAYGSAAFSYTDHDIHNIFLGSWYSPSNGYDFNGIIDEPRIYNIALTPAQIAAHYAAGSGLYGTDTTNMKLGLHFDEGGGLYTDDYSGNNNVGTLVGGVTWASGEVAEPIPASAVEEVEIIVSQDTATANVEGVVQFGDPDGQTQIRGSSLFWGLDDGTVYKFGLKSDSTTPFSADHTLTIDLDNADRTLTLSGSPTLGDWFDQSVKTTASPTFVGLTTSGDLINDTPYFVYDADTHRLGLGTATPSYDVHYVRASGTNYWALCNSDNSGTDAVTEIIMGYTSNFNYSGALAYCNTGVNLGAGYELIIGNTFAFGGNPGVARVLIDNTNASGDILFAVGGYGTANEIAKMTTTGMTMYGSLATFYRDSAIHIASLDDGHLDLTADTSIDLNGTVITTGSLGIGMTPTDKLSLSGGGLNMSPTYGSDVIIDGTFSTPGLTDWVLGAGWADGTGNATKNADGTGTLSQVIAGLTAGRTYKMIYTISSISGGSITGNMYAGTGGSGTARSSAGTYTEYLYCPLATSTLSFTPSVTGVRCVIDNVSMVQESLQQLSYTQNNVVYTIRNNPAWPAYFYFYYGSSSAILYCGGIEGVTNYYVSNSGNIQAFSAAEYARTGGYWTKMFNDSSNIFKLWAEKIRINTTSTDVDFEINNATGGKMRLTYNDFDGSAAVYADMYIDSDGDYHLEPSLQYLVLGKGTAATNYGIYFNGQTTQGYFEWMEDDDQFKFYDDIKLLGGENIVLDTSTGTKIGTATTQLLGFYNATPVDQPATVADAATQDLTGTDTVNKAKTEADLTSCKNAINAIIDRLQELGLIA